MIEKIFSLLCGIIFGIGLIVSGMTNPEKVIGFLSITNNWDASLIFVMGGAILVFAPAIYLFRKKEKSLLGMNIELPTNNFKIDKQLVFGTSLFGIGWGLVGFCPGPAVSSIAFFQPVSIIFLISMLAGIYFNRYFLIRLS
ncbi:MAG: YeeE/YedE family protein [Candidatus Marinimicrobia bacterium]|nr:YeeE/YedE family protein [Candidatus Neomarinimicrobiota bacterium]|tara:strand:+ start:2605 stop:3027 length:423 start_codon:yes stop_codon:yes gene_type:complete